MKRFILILLLMLVPVAAPAQRRGGGPPQPPPPKEVAATAIPGVIAAGAKIELVLSGVTSPEGSLALPDGSGIIFCERPAHIAKIDASGKMSTFVEEGNASNGLGWDSKG